MDQMTSRKGLNIQSVSYKSVFRLYFFLWWMMETVLISYVQPILRILPIVGQIGEYIIPAGMAFLLMLAVPHIISQLRATDLLFYLVVTIVVLGTMLLYPENGEYIEPELWRILGMTVPVYFLGLCYDHDEMKKDIYWASVLSLLAKGAYQIYKLNTVGNLDEEDMNSAYLVLPSVLYLVYWAFTKKNLLHWILPVAGAMLIFTYGTRGPLVIIIIYLAVLLFLRVIWRPGGAWRYVGTGLLVLAVLVLLTTNVVMDFAEMMSKAFQEMGISSRIFDKFLEGEFAESKSREILAEQVKDFISQNLILGGGFYADRALIDNYVHNLFLELWCHFGIFAGSGILLAVVCLVVSALLREREINKRDIMLLLACMIFVKLMLSSSYALEPYFFFMIGLSVTVLRRRKQFREW